MQKWAVTSQYCFTLTIWVWKIHLILSEGGIPLKQHLRQGRVKISGIWKQKTGKKCYCTWGKTMWSQGKPFPWCSSHTLSPLFQTDQNHEHFSCYKTIAIFIRKTKRRPWWFIRKRKLNKTVLKNAWRRHLCFKHEHIALYMGWCRNSLNCLQCLDFSSWAQTSEGSEAPLPQLLGTETLFFLTDFVL